MTQEEKVKRYDKALKRAKKLYEQGTITESLSYVFPELKESEEERIRKAAIEFVRQNKSFNYNLGISKEEVIAWLEKQGESIDINPSEFDLHLNKLLKQFETLPKEELVSSLSFYLNVVQNDGTYKEEKESEQKPTDKEMKTLLRTEYEKGRADAIAEIQNPVDCIDCTNSKGCINCEDGNMKETLVRKTAWSEEDEEELDIAISTLKEAGQHDSAEWLKSLKDKVQPKQEWNKEDESIALGIEQIVNCASLLNIAPDRLNKVRDWLKSLNERVQPKEELSEENARLLDNCISLIEDIPCTEDEQNWLKSLRPQNRWKPSDEQMKALNDMNLTGNISYAGQGKVLIELYNDLKTLKEY